MHITTSFKWRHFQAEIILLCVRWYLRFLATQPEKVPSLALYFGLLLQLQWNVGFFYSYDGNPTHTVEIPVN